MSEQTKPSQVFHCVCCGEPYEKGKFRCCAPPKNMRSDFWLERFCHCDLCAGPDKSTSGKCPRHHKCEQIKDPNIVEGFAHVGQMARSFSA